MSGLGPPILNSSIKSWNWPWISPHTVTGHFCVLVSQHVNKRDAERLPLAVRWIPLEEPREPIRTQLLAHVLPPVAMRRQRFPHTHTPSRTVSAHRSLPAACRSLTSRSSRPAWEWWQALSTELTTSAWAPASSRPPCWYPLWRWEKGISATRASTAGRGVVVRGVVVASNLADDVRVSQEGRTAADGGV